MARLMKERPILFSGAMVRAILDGSKTQTRRVLKVQPASILTPSKKDRASLERVTRIWGGCRTWFCLHNPPPASPENKIVPFRCAYGEVGDRLWVRETWHREFDDEPCLYKADGRHGHITWDERWRPSIHMRRENSRIDLEITGIRVERLQKITRADAIAEGMPRQIHSGPRGPIAKYRELWDKLNADRGFGWSMNPWVWVVEFKRVRP
jgi:hypothetical protein